MTVSPMDNQLIAFIFFNHPLSLLVIISENSIVIHLQVQEFNALLFLTNNIIQLFDIL